jgi:hypothetical protein
MARDKHYKVKGYRLDDKVIKELENLSQRLNLSYNQLFIELIKLTNKQ